MPIKAELPDWAKDPKIMKNYVDNSLEGLLVSIGQAGVTTIRDSIQNDDNTGKTRKSIMWATALNDSGDGLDEDEKLDRPREPYTVDIGSGYEVASFLEYGTSGHVNPDGSAEFVKAIKEWAQRKGIPDKAIGAIITSIRRYGTKAYPYMNRAKQDLEELVNVLGKKYAVEFVRKFNASRDKATIMRWNGEVSE